MKRPSGRGANSHHLLTEMQLRFERLDLLQQPVDQFLRPAHRQCRNVVDRLVGVELGALAARVLQRIDHLGADAQQAELEHLEQAAGSGSDDHRLDGVRGRFDRFRHDQTVAPNNPNHDRKIACYCSRMASREADRVARGPAGRPLEITAGGN